MFDELKVKARDAANAVRNKAEEIWDGHKEEIIAYGGTFVGGYLIFKTGQLIGFVQGEDRVITEFFNDLGKNTIVEE